MYFPLIYMYLSELRQWHINSSEPITVLVKYSVISRNEDEWPRTRKHPGRTGSLEHRSRRPNSASDVGDDKQRRQRSVRRGGTVPTHPQNISQEEQPNNMLELAGCSPLPNNQKKSRSPKEALQNRELKNLRSANVEGKSELAPMPWNRQRKPALAPSRTSYRRALENAQESIMEVINHARNPRRQTELQEKIRKLQFRT